ncbi:MAG: DUF2141 domain-containing protein [Bacteroidetes bacterium]|nr:DUF2141 domain-containing protein [Bacteroidota bacterium]
MKLFFVWGLFGIHSMICNGQLTLRIEVENFKTDKGVAMVDVYRENDEIPQKAFMRATTSIHNGKATFALEGLVTGSYAAIVFHDLNENGQLDHKFGLPTEPMGFSNEWKLSLFSGFPNFRKLSFKLDSTVDRIKIKIN